MHHTGIDQESLYIVTNIVANPKPMFSVAPTSCRLEQFAEISEQEVIKAALSLNNKQCDFDPLPTWLLKENIEYVAPCNTQLFNQSLRTGQVPTAFEPTPAQHIENGTHVVFLVRASPSAADQQSNHRP